MAPNGAISKFKSMNKKDQIKLIDGLRAHFYTMRKIIRKKMRKVIKPYGIRYFLECRMMWE
jgi:hypothetical protein